jgi:hypothetical protein
MRHESVGDYGYLGYPFVVGFYNWKGKAIQGAKFEHTFHQVRNPLRVIATWMKRTDIEESWQFIRKFIPEIQSTDPHIVQCAKYWYYWNKKAEALSEWRYQVEAFDEVIGEFEFRLGVSLHRKAMLAIAKNINSWKGKSAPVTWSLLKKKLPVNLYLDIQEMAKRYGYSTTDEIAVKLNPEKYSKLFLYVVENNASVHSRHVLRI